MGTTLKTVPTHRFMGLLGGPFALLRVADVQIFVRFLVRGGAVSGINQDSPRKPASECAITCARSSETLVVNTAGRGETRDGRRYRAETTRRPDETRGTRGDLRLRPSLGWQDHPYVMIVRSPVFFNCFCAEKVVDCLCSFFLL